MLIVSVCGSRVFTNQFVFFDEAAKLSTRDQLAPLSQDQLRTEDDMADKKKRHQ